MMILLSIKQIYCDLILNGAKRFEFRKRLPNGLQRGDEVAIYCTRPVSRVIAYFRIADVIQATRQSLWRQTRLAAGINYETFMRYFGATQQANAIKIGDLHVLNTPLSLVRLRRNKTPPQSFLYLTESQSAKVRKNARHH
jgi:predicted transcriptional regulator